MVPSLHSWVPTVGGYDVLMQTIKNKLNDKRVRSVLVKGILFVAVYIYANAIARQGYEPLADADPLSDAPYQERVISSPSHDMPLSGKVINSFANVGIFAGNAASYPVRIYLFRGGPFSGGSDHRTQLHYFSYLRLD
jgi:hypothetical protein